MAPPRYRIENMGIPLAVAMQAACHPNKRRSHADRVAHEWKQLATKERPAEAGLVRSLGVDALLPITTAGSAYG